MKVIPLVLAAALLGAPAQASESSGAGVCTIGPNFGFSVLAASGGGSSLVSVSWPGGVGPFLLNVQPGMRIGYVTPGGKSDIYLDSGVSYANSGGSTVYSVLNTLNFQLNFDSHSAATPYATAGAGFALTGYGGDSETRALLGLGVGTRRRISDGHGAFRAEFRYDRMAGAGGGDGLNSFGIKFGVDLWIP